jgi:hypothetical protein
MAWELLEKTAAVIPDAANGGVPESITPVFP